LKEPTKSNIKGGKVKGKLVLMCLNPRSETELPPLSGLTNPRVTDLAGKKIGIIWCGKQGGENFLDVTEELLKKRVPDATILRFVWGVSGAKEKIKEVDTFIYGVGDSGIGAWESTARTIALERLGKPGVVIFSGHLIDNAKASAYAQGMPTVRMVTVPSMDYYPGRVSVKRVRPIADATIDAIIAALTRPLTPEERNPEPKLRGETAKTIKITAESYESALEKFNRLFLENHWGDGLPLIPPTEEAVRWMLSGTTRSPGEVTGMIPSPDGLATIGIATIEKIAINAVMAGAKPEYLPVIIAAMEGLTDKNFSPHVFTSEGSFTLLIMVSGPIAKKIKMHSGIGLLGHGWRANNTIGRAVRLSLINIGHLWPAEYDMALIGRPSSHTFYVFAENEEYCPWEPYHVSQGYKPEESCVAVSTVGGHGSIGMKIYGGGTVVPWTAKGILNDIIEDVANDRRIFALYKPGEGSSAHPQKHIIVLHPELAIELQRLGFTNHGLRNYIIERTMVPYEALSPEEIRGIKGRIAEASDVFFGAGVIPEDRIPAFKEALKPGGKVPVVVTPDDIHIIVAGGISGYSFGMAYARGAHQTRLIR
jgi:hypothetical protein